MARIPAVAALAAALCGTAQAQPNLVVAAGVAVPGGQLGANRTVGPMARASVVLGSTDARGTVRIDAEVAHMTGGGGPNPWNDASLTSFAALANFIAAASGDRGLYLLIGGGIQRLHIRGERNPYDVTPGLRGGVGMRMPWRGRQLFVEAAAHLNLTDFGSAEMSTGYWFPVVAGLKF